MQASEWRYGHRRGTDREHVEHAVGWAGGVRGQRDAYSITLRDTDAMDAHGCAARLSISMSRAEAARVHASLGRLLAEHPTDGA